MIEVQYLMNYTFAEPSQLKLVVIADQVSSWYPHNNGNLRRVSPDESHHAFILATARDLGQKKSEEAWKREWLSCQATFVRLERHEDAFWRAGKEREIIGASYDTMYYTTALPSAVTALQCQLVFGKNQILMGVLLLSLLVLMFLFGSLFTLTVFTLLRFK